MADLVFLTIDQALSSFLTIPYSLSNRQANLNAGAIIGSYLVFDEFHLFPVDERGNGAMATTLQMLRMLRGTTPFVLMTATFSETMIDRLCIELGAEKVMLTPEEIQAIPSQQGKQRRYIWCPRILDAEAIINDMQTHQRSRVIAICNTVERAQTLATDLRSDERLADVHIELLHSRFYTQHRNTKEDVIRREFGEDGSGREWQHAILVATQVVEVGINITSQALHSELAPAASLVQRAGRCARFAGEQGDVFIYEVPQNKDGFPDYAPYIDDAQQGLCERTRDTLRQRLPEKGTVLTYHDELDLVNTAHKPYDEALLQRFAAKQAMLTGAMITTFRDRNRSAARELIRDIDTLTVLIHPQPNSETIPNPYRFESFGLRRGTLLRWFDEANQVAMERSLDWVAALGTVVEAGDEGSEPAEQRRRMTTQWHRLCAAEDPVAIKASCRDLAAGANVIVLNPELVQYDKAQGLRLRPGPTPALASPVALSRKREQEGGPLHRETYAEHIAGLQRVYRGLLRDRTAAVRRRLEQQLVLTEGILDRAIRLMFAVHDLGKLHQQWQEWAHAWQRKVSELRDDPSLVLPTGYQAAHTDYDSSVAREREAQRHTRPKRTNHAAESARAGRALLNVVAGDSDALYCALTTAIVCHHSCDVLRSEHGAFVPGRGARGAFGEAMRVVGLYDDAALVASGAKVAWEGFPAQNGLSDDLIRVDRQDDLLLYLFLARILRLADQGSQEKD